MLDYLARFVLLSEHVVVPLEVVPGEITTNLAVRRN